MNKIAFSAIFLLLCFFSKAQNCGNIVGFTANVSDMGGGMSEYTFQITMEATSGGSKSVLFDLSCPNNVFVPNNPTPSVLDTCVASEAITKVLDLGPFVRPTCTGDVMLTWTGKTNAACGGTTCIAENSISALVLPVELIQFQAKEQEGLVKLNWATASELNSSHFELERSSDGREFEKIGKVLGVGTSAERTDYKFQDKEPLIGGNYYRLRQVDFDGAFDYSKIVYVNVKNSSEMVFFPTQVQSLATLQFNTEEGGDLNISIFDSLGKMIMSKAFIADEGLNSYDLEIGHLAPGAYFISIEGERYQVTTTRFVKIK